MLQQKGGLAINPDCIDAVSEAIGRPLRKGEADRIEKSISRNMRQLASDDPEGWRALSSVERIRKGAAAAAKEMTDAVVEKQRLVKLQIAAHDRIEGLLQSAFDKLPEEGKSTDELKAFSNLTAFDSTNRGRGIQSAETLADSIKHESFGKLVDTWSAIKGFAGLFEDKRAAIDVERELWGEDSGNPTAKRAADAFKETTEELWDRANRAGAHIGKLEDWHRPQSYSQAAIATGGKDVNEALANWISKTLPRLDRSRYTNEDGSRMSDEQLGEKVLTPAFDTQITDGFNKVEPGQGGKGSGAGDMSGHRILFYKDANSYLAQMGDFGDKSLWRSIQDHVNRMSREIAMRETYGPNHAQSFQYFNDRLKLDALRANPEDAGKINGQAKYNQALYDYVAGNHQIVNQKVADVGQAFRNWQVATKLGGVVFTALGDEGSMASTAFANKIPWSDVLARELTYMNPANGEDRAAAAHAGIGINTMLGGLNRFGTEDYNMDAGRGLAGKAREFGAKFSSAAMKYSGAEPMWDIRRRALGSVLMSYLGKTVQEVPHFADVNEADHGILARKGFTENDWQVMRLAQPEDWGGQHGLLTPKSIRDIPDSKLSALGDPVDLRRHAASMLLGHVLEETNMGVMQQGARQRASLAGVGTTGGTAAAVGGELLRSSMLFKGFSAAMMQKHWTRAGSLPTGAGTAGYMARLFTIGTIAGGVALELQALARGEDPPNIVEPKFWGKAILKGGGLGYMGDFLSEAVNSNDNHPVAAAIGPVATTMEDAYNLTLGAAIKASQGERTDEAGNLIRFVRNNNPLNNWYTKAAFDHLIFNDMQEAVSPGYLDRMAQKAQKSRGTSWYYDPHESLPHAAPDFSKMLQPERGAEQIQGIEDVANAALGH